MGSSTYPPHQERPELQAARRLRRAGPTCPLLLTKGNRCDHDGATLLLPMLPPARELIGDRGYDSNWSRAALAGRGVAPCIPST